MEDIFISACFCRDTSGTPVADTDLLSGHALQGNQDEGNGEVHL